MTFMPHGKQLVAGQWVAGDATFTSEPAHGASHAFSVGTADQVDAACRAAEEAFWSYGYSSSEERAKFLNAIADEIEPVRTPSPRSALPKPVCRKRVFRASVVAPPASCACLPRIF